MSCYPVFPALLADAEFVLMRFGLDLTSPCTVGPEGLLGLRSLLLAAAAVLPSDRRDALFNPALSCDPAALRRYQKPAPPFVLRSVANLTGDYHEGDLVEFEVLFLGTGIMAIGDFLAVLEALGERGLRDGDGSFVVSRSECLGADGKWRDLRRKGRPSAELMPELLRLDQWLDRNWPLSLPVVFALTAPTRLVAGGRTLRRPRFRQLFPFLLRRVSSMLHAHCGLEPVDNPASLLEAATLVESTWLDGDWIDWRERSGCIEPDAIGGCVGRWRLDGTELESIFWVVLLATLFGIGKGAAYGAGSCDLFSAAA